MNNINTENYKFAMPLSIRWNDLDPLAHVNNVYYFEYFQIGRGHYMHAVSQQWDWQKYMFVIAHIECDYYKELTLSAADPAIKMRTSSIGRKSFEIEFVPFFLVGNNGIIQIVQIVIHRSPTRYAAHYVNTVLFDIVSIDFLKCVLVLPYYNSRFVNPQDKHLIVMCQVFKAILFESNIIIRFC